MELDAVERSYARWAPIYDKTFGAVTHAGRRRATALVNAEGGAVLEVGVGTGLALQFYAPHVTVTGIDFSEEMLAKARKKVDEAGYSHVAALRQMDARALDFPDQSFDHVCAMHIMSVVPDPEIVLSEMARVCKIGGNVLIVNHFAREDGALAMVAKLAAPLANTLGWHADFPRSRVLGDTRLRLMDEVGLPPLGMMTFLQLERVA